MYERIQRSLAHVLRHKVQEAVLALIGNAVEHERKTLFQIRIVLDHALHEFHVEGVVVELLFVGGEAYQGTVFLVGGDDSAFQEVSPAEMAEGALALAVGCHVEIRRHGVHGLGTHAVHTYGLLEVGIVKLAAGIELGSGVYDLIERNTAAEVPHGDGLVLYGNVYPLAESHGELVNGVVDDFLQEDIDSVSLAVSVSKAADVHTRTAADVLVPFQGLDGIVIVGIVSNDRCVICHSTLLVTYKYNEIISQFPPQTDSQRASEANLLPVKS